MKIAVIIFLILIGQIDDDLSNGSISLIERIEAPGMSESYLYLTGIFANNKEDPIDVGLKLIKEYKQLDADQDYNIIEYPQSKKIRLPNGKEFCGVEEEGCLEFLFSSGVDVNRLLLDHQLLIHRSNEFLQFTEFKTLSKPTPHEYYPPYQYIVKAERIKTLDSIDLYLNGEKNQAIDSLYLQFSKIRRSMSMQDNLIGRLVFLSKLSEIIDVMSIILTDSEMEYENIPSLTLAEKSFYMISAREFGISYYTLKELDRNPEFFEMGGNTPGWLTRIIYKPNMTINSIASTYHELDRLSRLSQIDFVSEIEKNNEVTPQTSKLRNYAGNILIGLGPNYNKYVARFFDFDAKLAVFNQRYNNKSNAIFNPYDKDEILIESKGSLCFDGPLEYEGNYRCLRVKI